MTQPTRAEVNDIPGRLVLEFGATWCPHCQAIQSTLKSELDRHPEVRHITIEDGKGLPLGRSFQVKLWPTLVFIRDGEIVTRLVRPSVDEIKNGFIQVSAN